MHFAGGQVLAQVGCVTRPPCPRCTTNKELSEARSACSRAGYFRRKSDCKVIQRYRCRQCKMHFSAATSHPCFRQHKRHFNYRLRIFLCSEGSQRRAAKTFHLSLTTVARKLVFVGRQALLELEKTNQQLPIVNTVEFDDLETFEHTKCKPLSVTLAVE